MVNWADPVLQKPYRVQDGSIRIPDTPGLGIDWNEDAVKKYLVEM